MFDAEFGKKITKLAFIGYFILAFLYLIFPRVFSGAIFTVLDFLFLLAAAGGFGLMWLSDRSMLDFATAAAVGLAALLTILGLANGVARLWNRNAFMMIIHGILVGAFYLVLAARVFQQNRIVGLLLICAFLYTVFGSAIFHAIIMRLAYRGRFGAINFVAFIARLGSTVCPAIAVLERMAEE